MTWLPRRRIILSLTTGLLTACTAETFSPPVADHFEVVQGAGQTGTPGWILDSLVVVRLLDDRGAPIVGTEVSWQVGAGSGSITHSSAVTGVDGLAVASWKLGLPITDQRLRISALGVDPITVSAEQRVLALTRIGTGTSFGCGIDENGVTWCWGDNWGGTAGEADEVSVPRPVAIAPDSAHYVELALGDFHACGRSATGEVGCWGMYWNGALGTGASGATWGPGTSTPVRPVGLPPVTSIVSADDVTCGPTAAGVLWCWGNAGGILASLVPTIAFPGTTFSRVALGSGHGCGISTGGQVLCWGSNVSGQLGNGTIGGSSAIPQPIAGAFTARAIASGDNGACAITTSSELYCWGLIFGIDGHFHDDPARGLPSRSFQDGSVRAVTLGGWCGAVWRGPGSPRMLCNGWVNDIETLPAIAEAQFGPEDVCLRSGTGAVYCKSYSDQSSPPFFDREGTAIPAP